MFADTASPPAGEKLFLLGVCHRNCLEITYKKLRHGQARLDESLSEVRMDFPDAEEPGGPDTHLPPAEGTCPFCQGFESGISKEDIYPKWLMRELQIRGAIGTRNGFKTRRLAGPTTTVCYSCNNNWMSTLENDVKPLILSLIDNARYITPDEQGLLAFWATKMAVLFDAAGGHSVLPRGFAHDLNIARQPHHATKVWVVAYADPSDLFVIKLWHILAKDSDDVIGLCVTFSIVRIAFQVLIPLYESELSPLNDFLGSVEQIWPPQDNEILWPPTYVFDHTSIVALSQRVYDNREPVSVEVTLMPSRRLRSPEGGKA